MINKKRWSKKHTKITVAIGLVLVIVIIIVGYFLSPSTKLKKKGYSKYDISTINENVSKGHINKIIDMKYVPVIASIIEDPNYNEANIIKYMEYYLKHKKVTLKNVVIIVNANADDYDYSEFLVDCVQDKYYMYVNIDRYITYHEQYENAPAHDTIILVNSEIDKVYTEKLGSIINEDYFIVDNTERYINYSDNHPQASSKDIVSIVNSFTDYQQYSVNNPVDFTKGFGVLVNKYHKLNSSFNNSVAVTLTNDYAEGTIKLDPTVATSLMEMLDVARENGYDVVVKRGYLNNTELTNLYYAISKSNGEWYADSYLGKPGYNEYQTGYAVGLAVRGDSMENFGNTAAFKWISENAYGERN